MRLVDADSLDVAFQNEEEHFADSVYEFGISDGIALMHSLVDDAPTIDAVPVVRCRECIYRVKLTAECTNNGGVWEDDGYCSDGQRREDGDA